ncbi:MAG: hypothetical protein JJT76_06260 [Clostridiaceae bacterium]|nr:hypothetical protein [Clostridiaceae bacterium]
MHNTLDIILGVLIVLFGLVILTRRKFMVKRGFINTFIFFMIILNRIIGMFQRGYGFSYLFIVLLPLLALVIIISKGRYLLTNVNKEIVSSTLIDILEEKNISYEEDKNAVILADYDNKRISYNQSLNIVEINLKDVINLPFYKELKAELRSRIKAIHFKIFPTLEIFLIVLGATYIGLLQYL